jgi:NAD(P)-dependent dehydrogenase (short-subunit alcohol dehydrogenase family)
MIRAQYGVHRFEADEAVCQPCGQRGWTRPKATSSSPAEVAAAVAFLASSASSASSDTSDTSDASDASYVNGRDLVVDGGPVGAVPA